MLREFYADAPAALADGHPDAASASLRGGVAVGRVAPAATTRGTALSGAAA
jgi:hypothetical protein